MRLLVISPTYQEAENIDEFLTATRAHAPDAHILIVDDGSPDGTADLVDARAQADPLVSVLRRSSKQGLGSAYRAAFAQVLSGEQSFDLPSFDVVVHLDADLSHDPASIPTLLAALGGGADVVIGSRYVTGGSTVGWPFHRRVLSRWGNRYTSAVLGLRVRDITSGFRAYRIEALRALEPTSTEAEGYAFLTELMLRASDRGLRIAEVPIRFVERQRGRSKMSWQIIVESMLMVTGLGVRRAVRGWRRTRRTTP